MRLTLVATVVCLLGGRVAQGQIVTFGVQGALGDYRETTAALHFRGPGVAGSLGLHYARFSADGSVTRMSYDPRDNTTGLMSFKATEVDAHVGYEIAGGVIAEVGFLRRYISPDLAAQEMSAARVGIRYSRILGPGADISLRGNYLAGAKFTGAGSADMAFELGLLLSAGSQNGRYRLTADYGFQRIDRKVGSAKAPIQQSVVRLGVALGL